MYMYVYMHVCVKTYDGTRYGKAQIYINSTWISKLHDFVEKSLAFSLSREVIFLTNIIPQQILTKGRHCVREELEALVRLALNEVSIAEFRDHVDQIGSSVGVPCRYVAMESIIRAYKCTFMYCSL